MQFDLYSSTYSKTEQEVLGKINRRLFFDTAGVQYKTTPPTIPHWRWNIFI
jgi:hypothetical protein